MSTPRAAIGASLLFLLSGAVAGVVIRSGRIDYATFGLTEGVIALFLLYLLLHRRIWELPAGPLRWLPITYGAWATAQLLELLLPPAGLLEWVVVPALALAIWAGLLWRGPQEHIMAALASAAVLLALLNFSIIPALWAQSAPAADAGFGVGAIAEGLRQVVVSYRPVDSVTELFGVAGISLWAIATHLLWSRGATDQPGGEGARADL